MQDIYRNLFMKVLTNQGRYRPADDLTGDDFERIARYERNLKYYLESQYDAGDQAMEGVDFSSLESVRRFVCNLTSAVSEVVNIKSSWIYGKGAIRVFGLKGVDPNTPEGKEQVVSETLAAVERLRVDSDRDAWDIVSAIHGCIYGDFFRYIDFDEVSQTVRIIEEDPMFCFPRYDKSGRHMIRFVQNFVASNDESSESVEYYRTWTLENPNDLRDAFFREFSPEEFSQYQDELEELGSYDCCLVYREFQDDELVDYKVTLGFDEIPWVHGRNLQLTGTFGLDEISKIIAKIEKLNAVFRYAERVMYVNAHAKVVLMGVEGRKVGRSGPMKSGTSDALTIPDPNGDAKVLSLPSDTELMKFVAERIEKAIYKTASIPPIALADDLTTVGQLSGLALQILYAPLVSNTELRQSFYEMADRATYRIALKAMELVSGAAVGSMYPNPEIDYKDWHVPVPQSRADLVNDIVKEYTAGIISRKTAIEMLGFDPRREEPRLETEAQQALDSLVAQQGIGADTFSSEEEDGGVIE